MAQDARFGGRIGLALGSGAARGWAPVGVIRGLLAAGIVPELVAGSSSGALVGDVRRREARRLRGLGQGPRLATGGRLLRPDLPRRRDQSAAAARRARGEPPGLAIEELLRSLVCVATDLASSREVWLRRGALLEALRASFAVPGRIAPLRIEGRWLVKGRVANPVPVSLCGRDWPAPRRARLARGGPAPPHEPGAAAWPATLPSCS